MAMQGRGSGKRRLRASRRYGIAAVAVAVGIAGATAYDVAWADTGQSDSAGGAVGHSAPANPGPKKVGDRHGSQQRGTAASGPGAGTSHDDADSAGASPGTKTKLDPARADSSRKKAPRSSTVDGTDVIGTDTGTGQTGTRPDGAAVEPDLVAPQPDSAPVAPTGKPRRTPDLTAVKHDAAPTRVDDVPAATPATGIAPISPSAGRAALATHSSVALSDRVAPAAAAVTTTTVTPVAPTTPAPLSPIAKVLQLPGRIVNAFLQMLDMTVASGHKSPFNFGPIGEFLFAAFRRVEEIVGFDKPPAVQQVLPTLTYDPPSTLAKTPTVAQFLNASAAAYVLGGMPGGLVPLTVNGFQMQYSNIFTGAVGKVWVTPQQQVIIAYQGTTGGTNLLFNPLIAISQIVTDLQVIFTSTTPPAFTDALNFAQRVRAEAAAQGYAADDVFVTGHSLGAWQAQYVAQQTGLAGIGFEGPGMNTTVPGNGADSMFVNVETYGDAAAYMSTDLPGLQPFMPPYQPGGGAKPHYGSIVMIGDAANTTPMQNAATLWGRGIIGSIIAVVDILGNFFQYHLPAVQAYHLDVDPDPGVVPWLGSRRGTIHEGWGDLTIQGLMAAASDAGRLIKP